MSRVISMGFTMLIPVCCVKRLANGIARVDVEKTGVHSCERLK